MKQVTALVLFLFLTGILSAQTQQNKTTSATTTPRKKAASGNSQSVAAQLELLRKAMQAQEQQILHLNDQVQIRDQQIQQLQQAVQQTQQQRPGCGFSSAVQGRCGGGSVYRSSADGHCS